MGIIKRSGRVKKPSKKELKRMEIEKKTGIVFENSISGGEISISVWKVLLNALLVFMAVVGSIECFAVSFEIPYNKILVITTIFIISMAIAFFYKNNNLKIIGYIMLLVVFVKGVWEFRAPINSGFSRILNVILEFVEEQMNLPVIKRYAETVADRNYSVTICFIFLGCVLGILFNIAITESSGFIDIMLISIFISQLGVYFGLSTSTPAFFMLIVCYIVIASIRFSERYRIPNKKKQWIRIDKKNTHTYECRSDSKSAAKLGFSIIVFCSLFITIISIIYPKKEFKALPSVNVLRASTMEPIRNFLIAGVNGLFGSKQGAGGVGGGRLGEVSTIKNDYKTDLKVTMVPLSDETIYLKAYVGSVYVGDHWEQQGLGNEGKRFSDYLEMLKIDNVVPAFESYRLNLEYNSGTEGIDFRGKIRVENVDATEQFVYMPYYSEIRNNNNINIFSDDVVLAKDDQRGYEFTYYPYELMDKQIALFGDSIEKYDNLDDTYEHKVLANGYETYYKIYAQSAYEGIPYDLREYLDNFCEEAGFKSENEGLSNLDAQSMNGVVQRVINYLWKNYDYSMMPGRTPQGEDFVRYFLEKNKKGYCSHFATASTLIFRNLGIPARYVEGYVITDDIIQQGNVLVNEKAENWLEGNTEGLNQNVMELYVPDANAHAWVEIYQEGFGWIPVEVTPPDYNNDDDIGGFGFSDIFGDIVNNIGIGNLFTEGGATEVKNLADNIILGFIILVIMIILITIIRILIIRYKRKKSFYSQNNNISVINLYKYLKTIMGCTKYDYSVGLTNEEYLEKLVESGSIEKIQAEAVFDIIQKAAYSEAVISTDELDNIRNIIFNTADGIKSKLGIFKKLTIFIIKGI